MTEDVVVRCAIWTGDLRRDYPPLPSHREFAFVEVRPDEQAPRLARAMAVEEREVVGRLERGCRAFAAWDWPGEMVSWLWVSTGQEWAPPLRRTLHIPPGDCYGWNAGTVERCRGRGLFTGLLEYAGRWMARQGCQRMWTGVLDDNLASQRGHLSAGFRPVLRVVAQHEPPPTRIDSSPADGADDLLVGRARQLLGEGPLHITGQPRPNGRRAAGAGSGAR
jgi:GNAT superfamily N-acetyltransferase